MKHISIIIVTYNSMRLIKDCIESIFDNNDIEDALDVIVVDNASDDQKDLFSFIENRFGDKPIKCYDSGGNWGYGKGNNLGIAKTDADIVIVMNPDVRFTTPVFERILKEFENKNIGMAGVSFIDGSLPYFFKPEYKTLYRQLFIHSYVKKWKYDPVKMYLSGSLLIFDRASFIEAGKFDEHIFMYFEEPDITNRIQQRGKNVKWLNDVFVQHLAHGRSYNQKLIDVGYSAEEYYCKKYGIDVKRLYRNDIWMFRIKIIAAWLTGASDRLEVFQKTLKSLNKHIRQL